jgi:CarD family transcriptional regulator
MAKNKKKTDKKNKAKKVFAEKVYTKKAANKKSKNSKVESSKLKKTKKLSAKETAVKKNKITKTSSKPDSIKEKKAKIKENKNPKNPKKINKINDLKPIKKDKIIEVYKPKKLPKDTKEKNKIEKFENIPIQKNELKPIKEVKKNSDQKTKIVFKVGDYAVYPSHGIGKIVNIEKIQIMNKEYSCYLMYFEKERLTIKIPKDSTDKIGMRHLVSKNVMDEVFQVLRSGIKKLKGMWSRRAQEYETKINSGDIMLLAEVLRDLTRDIEDSDRSYSERIIYETAVYRLASEYSVIFGVSFDEAKNKIISTAKDKVGVEGRIIQKDDFDDFDDFEKKRNLDEEEDDDEEEEEEEDDFSYDGIDGDFEEDDEKPKKRKKRE